MFARLPLASVANSLFALGAKKPPPADVSDNSYRFFPYPVLSCNMPKPVPGSARNGENVRPAIDEGTNELRLNCISFVPTRSPQRSEGKQEIGRASRRE